MDINPATRGHALVIPRAHARDLHDLQRADLAACFTTAQRLAGACARAAGAAGVQPAELHRRRRLADRLPLPRARDPALRGRPAAAAVGPRPRRRGRDRRGGAGAARMSPALLERTDDGLALVTLDKPPLNLFDAEMLGTLIRRDRHARGRSATGAAAARGRRRGERGGRRPRIRRPRPRGSHGAVPAANRDIARRVESLHCPTVFAAHGLCLTAAFELALACDLLLAAESAQLRPRGDRGRPHAGDGRHAAPGRARRPGARELVMTGALYDAATLERWNVVNRVLPDDGFAAKARQYAQRLAAGPAAGERRHEGGSCAPACARRRGRGRRARCRRPRASCSGPRTCRARCARSSPICQKALPPKGRWA